MASISLTKKRSYCSWKKRARKDALNISKKIQKWVLEYPDIKKFQYQEIKSAFADKD